MSTIYKDENTNLKYLKINNQSKKLMILLHGYGASMNDLYPLGEYVQNAKSFDWIFPNAPIELQFMGMHSAHAWFPIDERALESAMMRGEHRKFHDLYPDEFDIALNLLEKFIEAQNYTEIHIGGFSQGAMLSSHLQSYRVKNLKSLSLLSANLIGQDQLERVLSQSHKVPFFQSHGKVDNVLSYEYAKDLFESLKLGGLQGEFVSFNGGHEIPMDVLSKWNEFLGRFI